MSCSPQINSRDRRVTTGLSILSQIGEQLDLPIAPSLLEELTVLARAQRRALRAAHRQLEADPLLAQSLGYPGGIHDWRKLLDIFARP